MAARRPVSFSPEDSPRGLGRTLGKRVGFTPSRVRISYPPPVHQGERLPGRVGRDQSSPGAPPRAGSLSRRIGPQPLPDDLDTHLPRLFVVLWAGLGDRG